MKIEEFLSGNEQEAYNFFGCHLENGGAVFRVYAPAAERVSLIGECNNWTETPMNRIDAHGVFAVFIMGVKKGQMYKYKIYTGNSSADYSDPYGFGMEMPPASASIVRDLTEYKYHDKSFEAENQAKHFQNIYEVHMASWKKEYERCYRYDEMAELLLPYLTEYGYDSVSFLPFMEYDNDYEGGFLPTGFFAPSARFGTAMDCQKMVDRLHQKQISVMFEFPWEHFSQAGYGLLHVTGIESYGKNGTFDTENGMVVSFLRSAIVYWMTEYHFDGVKLVLSDDDDKNHFVEKICEDIGQILPGKVVYVEPSGAGMDNTVIKEAQYRHVLYNDTFWLDNILSYFHTNIWDRMDDNALLKAIYGTYTQDENGLETARQNRVLGISLQALRNNGNTVIEHMSGSYDEKFAQARVLYLYQMLCPGRKLDFMGNEIAHFRMWEAGRIQDWNLLDYDKHVQFTAFIKKLHALTKQHTVLRAKHTTFTVTDFFGEGSTLFAMQITDAQKKNKSGIMAVYNLSGNQEHITLPQEYTYALLLSSDSAEYGGTGKVAYEQTVSRELDIAPLSAVLFAVTECKDSDTHPKEEVHGKTDDVKPSQENLEEVPENKEAESIEENNVTDCPETDKSIWKETDVPDMTDNNDPWYYRAVLYHIYPLGFCGAPEYNEGDATKGSRILEVLDWIPHLKQLGVNAVYFGPIFASGWHGYDTYDYYQTDSRLGTNEEFKRVFACLHENGIRVVLDGVFNHVGRGFAAFRDLQQNGATSRYKDWFSSVNFSGRSAGGDNFSYDTWQGNYELVKLNLYNEEVVQHLLGAVKMWMEEFGIDGLRLDAADCIDKNFFKRLKSFTKGIKQDFWLMGEIIHGDYNMWANDEMMDSVTNYECWKGIYSSHNDKNYFEIAHSLNRQFGKGGIYAGKRFYNFLDNHDVNRIASLLKDKRDLGNAYTLLFLMPGIPSVYYGSEWGIDGVKTSGREADRPVRPAMRDIQTRALDGNLAAYISQLAQMRKTSAPLIYGEFENVIIKNEQYVFARYYEDKWVLAAFNISENQAHFAFNYRGKDYDFTVEPHANVIV